MKSIAFAPGHISGFFEPVYNQDIFRTGSCSAGINISLGAISEITVESSAVQSFEIYVNNKKSNDLVIKLALKHMLNNNPIHVKLKTNLDLPFGHGFGMSAASSLSATYALSKIIGVSKNEAMMASHFSEVQLKTGLGDVLASCFGGIEIRKSAGLPPWGIIEHIPGKYELVLCVIGKKLDTKKILQDQTKTMNIVNYGKYCTKKILEKPSIENLFFLSQTFTKKTKLADKNVMEAINCANQFGMASMCMLGNSVFALGQTDKLCKVLSPFGKVFVCCVDDIGARIL